MALVLITAFSPQAIIPGTVISVPFSDSTREIYPLQAQATTLKAIVSAYTGDFPVLSAVFSFEFKVPGGAWTNITSVPYLSSTQTVDMTEPGKAVLQSLVFVPVRPVHVRCIMGVYDVQAAVYDFITSNMWAICAIPDPRFAFAVGGEAGTYRFKRLVAGGYV